MMFRGLRISRVVKWLLTASLILIAIALNFVQYLY
jgi:hypothetical protein